jgi:hypothetical protein
LWVSFTFPSFQQPHFLPQFPGSTKILKYKQISSLCVCVFCFLQYSQFTTMNTSIVESTRLLEEEVFQEAKNEWAAREADAIRQSNVLKKASANEMVVPPHLRARLVFVVPEEVFHNAKKEWESRDEQSLREAEKLKHQDAQKLVVPPHLRAVLFNKDATKTSSRRNRRFMDDISIWLNKNATKTSSRRKQAFFGRH